jgi:DNA-binding response OmpR family regulator
VAVGGLSGPRTRVLVIEDDEAIQGLVRDLLALEGYDVAGAANGKDGLRLLRDWDPHLIVLDLMMPGMDGWTFLRQQRRSEGHRTVPVIVASAAGGAAGELPAAAFLPKPFDVGELVSQVRHIVGPAN